MARRKKVAARASTKRGIPSIGDFANDRAVPAAATTTTAAVDDSYDGDRGEKDVMEVDEFAAGSDDEIDWEEDAAGGDDDDDDEDDDDDSLHGIHDS